MNIKTVRRGRREAMKKRNAFGSDHSKLKAQFGKISVWKQKSEVKYFKRCSLKGFDGCSGQRSQWMGGQKVHPPSTGRASKESWRCSFCGAGTNCGVNCASVAAASAAALQVAAESRCDANRLPVLRDRKHSAPHCISIPSCF